MISRTTGKTATPAKIISVIEEEKTDNTLTTNDPENYPIHSL
jgi:hypothetical protein